MQNKIYYKIGEVCEITGLKPSIVRFWEKEFHQLRPLKLSSNQRYYTSNHIDLLNKIKYLLYEEKLTIEGAKKKAQRKNNRRKTFRNQRGVEIYFIGYQKKYTRR